MQKNTSFIILCDNFKLKDLKLTLYWLSVFKKEIIVVLPPTKDKIIVNEFKKVCNIYQSKESLEVSMINKGLKVSKSYWNIILKSGAIIKNSTYNKINYFKQEGTVLYGITPKDLEFYNSLKWMILDKDVLKKTGFFNTDLNDLESKLDWSQRLYNNKFYLKGIVSNIY